MRDSAPRPTALHPADLRVCRNLLSAGSRSFALAARLLPRDVRDDATALYAFCREADDAIDCSVAPHAALLELSCRLDAIYAGVPEDRPVDRAMTAVVARHRLPRALPDALLEGLAWDVAGRDYETIAALRAYAVRVAGTVGVMMTLIMGRDDHDTLARACELGVAMQLTNIARDIGEDADLGRCYVPRDWRRATGGPGLGEDASRWSPVQRRAIVKALLDAADGHYRAAMPGIATLPGRCRIGVRAAARIYAEIGTVVAAQGYDSVSRRAVVSTRRKFSLLGAACRADVLETADATAPSACAEIARLVDDVSRERGTDPRPVWPSQTLRWWQLGAQWAWVLELFERMALQERIDRERSRPSNEVSRSTATQQR